MNIASAMTRAATLAALLISASPGFARAGGHATHHANAAVQNAAKQEAAAHRQQQAMIHQQQAMARQQQHQAIVNRGAVHHNVNRGNINRNANNLNTGPMVSSLHSVMAELHQADHDYQGHRVQAIHHLGQAIHTLQPQSTGNNLAMNTVAGIGKRANVAATGNRASTGVAGAPAPKMAQAESDAHLNRARQSLLNMQSQMTGANTNNHQHVQTAHSHVQRAMQELNLALNIR